MNKAIARITVVTRCGDCPYFGTDDSERASSKCFKDETIPITMDNMINTISTYCPIEDTGAVN